MYDELIRSVPDHPQLAESEADRARRVDSKLRLLGPFLRPDARVLEIGAGDGAFAARAAELVGSVIAVDVSAETVAAGSPSPRVRMVLTDGTALPLPDASIDVAFSDQLMEHLHPDDAATQLRSIARVVAPGGWYVLSTPSRLSGPHDVSGAYDEVATGLHLHEYTSAELTALLRSAGFATVRPFAGGQGHFISVPMWLLRATERLVTIAPRRLRRRVGRFLPIRAVLGLHLAAQRD